MRACYEFAVFRLALAAVLVATFALSLPSAVLADSAGDNQYQDPFSNVPAQPKHKNKTSGTTTTPTQTPAATPSPTTPASTPTATTATPGSSSTGTLPRTGFPLVPVAIAGGA